MKLIKPSIEWLWCTPDALQTIERAGRTCYKSEDRINTTSAYAFVKMLLDRGHEAMIEHASMSYRIICDRGVTHEIVRHRLFSYAQESTRYCNYSGGVKFILPCWINLPVSNEPFIDESGKYCGWTLPLPLAEQAWFMSMFAAEKAYIKLLEQEWTPQQARSVLPNSLKTEIVVTGNLREWRHFFGLRTAKVAHPQMQEIANLILVDAQKRIKIVFDGIR